MSALSLLPAFVLGFAGLAALALAMDRHHRQVWPRGLPRHRRVLWRLAGVAGLLASFAVCAAQAGWAVGAVLWLGLLSAAAPMVTLVLSYRPDWLARAARPWRGDDGLDAAKSKRG